MKQHGSKWMNALDIRYLNIFRKFAQQIQVRLKSDTKNGHFTVGGLFNLWAPEFYI